MTKIYDTTANGISRRGFLQGGAGLIGAAGLGSLAGTSPAFAANFPDKPLNIIIPTGEGGGADRDARAFVKIWAKYLKTNFKFAYYPGAAGEVGYKFYMNSAADCYNLLFANLGPEVIMLELKNAGIQVGRDITYVEQTLSEPMAVWVAAKSPIKTLKELVAEGKKRKVTCSVSRLPHPASIGMLSIAEDTGAQITLVPYGGGNPSAMAAITGEVDCCALPLTNAIVLADQVRILGIFDNKNVAPADTGNAPTVNEALGTNIPPMKSSRAWGLQTAALKKYPDRVKILTDSMSAVLKDPEYAATVKAAGVPVQFIDPGNEAEAMASAKKFEELAKKYHKLLTGK